MNVHGPHWIYVVITAIWMPPDQNLCLWDLLTYLGYNCYITVCKYLWILSVVRYPMQHKYTCKLELNWFYLQIFRHVRIYTLSGACWFDTIYLRLVIYVHGTRISFILIAFHSVFIQATNDAIDAIEQSQQLGSLCSFVCYVSINTEQSQVVLIEYWSSD